MRRSARLAVAPKRTLAEDGLTDTESLSPRPTKRARFVFESQRTSIQPKTVDGKTSQRTRSSLKPVKARPVAQKKTGGAGSRSGRIPASFLQKCVANTPSRVACGAEGCETILNLKDLKNAHEHLRSHYEDEELNAAQILCAWSGCGELISNRGNTGELLRHYDRVHLQLRYGCPGKCTDNKGKARTWSRPDALTRHERTNPCSHRESPSRR